MPLVPAPLRPDLVCFPRLQGGGDLDGLPTLLRIKELYAQAKQLCPPVVFLTGEADPAEHAKYRQGGAVQVLVKPVTLEGLRRIGWEVVSAAGAAGSDAGQQHNKGGGGSPA